MSERRLIPVSIEKFIASMDEKLPCKIVGYKPRPYLELWNCSVDHYIEPIREKINHRHKMRLAWLASGKTGLIEYLSPFIVNRKKFERLRIVLLAIVE